MNSDYINCVNIPLGLEMALSRNLSAMKEFSKLSETEKNKFIDGCRNVHSKDEMQNYVNSLTSGI